MITKAQLIADGCQRNPNGWIGDGWLFCVGCKKYAYHRAYSRPRSADLYEVCLLCDAYHGDLPLKGSSTPCPFCVGRTGMVSSTCEDCRGAGIIRKGSTMSVAADILENAKEFTKRYASRIVVESDTPFRVTSSSGSQVDIHPIPSRVFVLLQSGTVLGVLSNEQKAINEARELMAFASDPWETLAPNRIWRSPAGVIIEISAHDVR